MDGPHKSKDFLGQNLQAALGLYSEQGETIRRTRRSTANKRAENKHQFKSQTIEEDEES